ncbi:MAG: hypothetical protein WBP74_04540 [Nitrososphaeraceae archaeon]
MTKPRRNKRLKSTRKESKRIDKLDIVPFVGELTTMQQQASNP